MSPRPPKKIFLFATLVGVVVFGSIVPAQAGETPIKYSQAWCHNKELTACKLFSTGPGPGDDTEFPTCALDGPLNVKEIAFNSSPAYVEAEQCKKSLCSSKSPPKCFDQFGTTEVTNIGSEYCQFWKASCSANEIEAPKVVDCATPFTTFLQSKNEADYCTKSKTNTDDCRTECSKIPGCAFANNQCKALAKLNPSEATLEFYKTKVDPNYKGPIPVCALEGDCRDVNDLLLLLVNYGNMLFGLAGSIALLVFIIGGVTMILSFGSADKTKKGMEAMLMSVVGLIILFGAYIIVNFALDALGVKSTFRGI